MPKRSLLSSDIKGTETDDSEHTQFLEVIIDYANDLFETYISDVCFRCRNKIAGGGINGYCSASRMATMVRQKNP